MTQSPLAVHKLQTSCQELILWATLLHTAFWIPNC